MGKVGDYLSAALPLTGDERLTLVQGTATREATARDIADTASVRELSVMSYDAVGSGLVSDQAPLENAVAAADAAGADLYTPPGTYLSTANIPDLHSVTWRGPGAIKRGSDTFYVCPRGTQTNTIYVSASGSAANDGITSSEPTTLNQAAAIILAYAERGLPGRWVVQCAAGTYTVVFNLDSLTWSDYPITLKGPSVGGHPNVPTMIIDMSANTGGRGVSMVQGGWLLVEDVKVINATTGYAFYAQDGSHLNLTNCHTDNCLYGVISMFGAHVDIFGGDYDGNSISGGQGLTGFFGGEYTCTGATNAAAALFHHWDYGIFLGEAFGGHLDRTRVHDCDVGVRFHRSAGANNTLLMQIYRCGIGVKAENQWFNNGIDFGTVGAGTANTIKVEWSGNAPETDYRNIDYQSKTPRVQQARSALAAHTGTTTKTLLWTIADIIRPWMLSDSVATGDYIEVEAAFTATLTTSNAAISLELDDGTTIDLLTTVTAPSGTTDFVVKFTLFITGYATATCTAQMLAAPAQGTDMVDEGSSALSMLDKTGNLKLYCQLGDTGDTVNLRWARCITTLGG